MIVNKTFCIGFLILTTCSWIVKSGNTDPLPSTSKDVNPFLGNQGQNNQITEGQLEQQKNTIRELSKTVNENTNRITDTRKEVLKLMNTVEVAAETQWYNTVVSKITDITLSITASNAVGNSNRPEQKFQFNTKLINNLNDAIDLQKGLINRYREVQSRPNQNQITEEKLKEQRNVINQLTRTLNENTVIINNARKNIYKFLNQAESQVEVSDYKELMPKVTDIMTSLTSLKNGGDSIGRTPEQKFQFQATLIKNLNDATVIQYRMKKRYAIVRNIEEDKLSRLSEKIEKSQQAELQQHLNEQKRFPARQQQLAQEHAHGAKLATDIQNQVRILRSMVANDNFDSELYYQKKQPVEEVYNSYKKHLINVENRRASEQNAQKQLPQGPQIKQFSQSQSIQKPFTSGSQVQAAQGSQVPPSGQWQHSQGLIQQNTNRRESLNSGKGRTV